MIEPSRCSWCMSDPIYIAYHDHEWGVPVYDDRHLFEMLNLEGMQAGLSWITVLKRREQYRQAFHNFDPVKINAFTEKDVECLMQNTGIIRNRLKIKAIIQNAGAYLRLTETQKWSDFLWQFKDAETMSKALKKKGFTFVGSTICYAFMQAVGMVNDHSKNCFLYKGTK